MSVSEEKIKQIEELALKGFGRPSILEKVDGASEWDVRKTLKKLRQEPPEEITEKEKDRLFENSKPSNFEVISELAPIHINVPRNRKKTAEEADLETVVFIGDTHGQFVDQRALDVACQIIEDVKPHKLVHLGDLGDFYSMSSFDKDPMRRIQLQDDVEACGQLLGQITQTVSDDTPKYLVQGNHEDRMWRFIRKNAPALASLPQLQIENLLGLSSIGWEFVDYDLELQPEFLIKHGDMVRKHSGYTAKAELEKSWMSGISGHTHRLAVHEFTSRRNFLRDRPPAIWIENGCLCQPDMEYLNGNGNWQQGFTVMHFDGNGACIPELVHIFNGKAYYNGRMYKG